MSKRIIYSNYELYDRFDDTKQMIMDEYPELCTVEVEDNEGNICYEPSDNKVWDFIYDDDSFEWDSVWADLKRFFANNHVIFTGSLGRWDGQYAGGKIGNFEDLFYDAIQDCDYIEIADEDGHLYLECSHHDGSNEFEIKLLTDKGYNFADNWEYSYEKKYDFSEQELHRRIMNCSFLSHLPHFAEKVFG